jgi:hypothetical protein
MKNRFFFTRNGLFIFSQHSGIPLSTLLEWYKIRETFVGENYVSQNIPLALELASSCAHPDARWLTEACAGKDVTTKRDAERIFSSLGQNDARALCFLWWSGGFGDLTPLRRSAELGFGFAQAWMAGATRGPERFKFAQLAAAQREYDGFYWLGWCFSGGHGCEKDLGKAKENVLLACELGSVCAMHWLGVLLVDEDAQRWRWWGRSAAFGARANFLANFVEQVELFNSGARSAAVMFAIGRALQGHLNEEDETIFGAKSDFDLRIGPAKQAVAFYESQIKATKDAMRAWTLVGIHFNVVKDVRKLIAKLIWDSREDALFK